MRLHRLSMTAFGPFAGTVDIDFDDVASSGLFLIRGATGAGKTSILDAVCFALYAAVPGARPSGRSLRSDHAAPDVVPSVTLEFTASERRFRVERSPEFLRPKKRGQGMTKAPARVVLHEQLSGSWVGKDNRHDDVAAVLTEVLGMGHNELLLRDALRGRKRENAVISVKFGALRGPDGSWNGVDTRPAAIKNFLAYSLRRLGTDHIDIYRPARTDASIPIEETVGALAEMVQAGYIRHIGLSEVGADTLRRAHAVHPITDLQIEYSLISRGIEDEILPTARDLGIGVTAYGVLSRGLISGHWSADRAARDFRGHLPRFSAENLERNLALVEALRSVAQERGASVAQVAIAWVLSRGQDIVPLVGARRRDRLSESLGALDLQLGQNDLAAIEAAVPADAAAGTRYDAMQMSFLDSER